MCMILGLLVIVNICPGFVRKNATFSVVAMLVATDSRSLKQLGVSFMDLTGNSKTNCDKLVNHKVATLLFYWYCYLQNEHQAVLA